MTGEDDDGRIAAIIFPVTRHPSPVTPMPRRSARRTKKRTNRTSRLRLPKLWPGAQARRSWCRALRRAPAGVQVAVGATLFIALWLATNGIYQVVLKPSELFFPVSGTLYKTPTETWRSYERIFRKHSTSAISPHFLAALAQVEGSGNPVVRTYWRWSLTGHPFKVYRPASSAVGMYQTTDGTFALARRYCVHDNVVVADGPWNDFQSCWFNDLYTRVVPSHAVEMTSAYLDRQVAGTLARQAIRNPTSRQKLELAAIIHLCGAGAGERYARRGLRLRPGDRCGDHDVQRYLTKVDAMRRIFLRLDR